MIHNAESRYAAAKATGTPLSTAYYARKLPDKDKTLKIRIEEALNYHPAYGHKRLAIHLGVNKKRILRVMRLFGIEPYRRRRKRTWKYKGKIKRIFPNLVHNIAPIASGITWAADFTYLPWRSGFVYLATVIDIYSREIVGWNVMTRHSAALVLQAYFHAIAHRGRPQIFHSDNGREYNSVVMIQTLEETGVNIILRGFKNFLILFAI